jgi:hypothetical protein
VICHLARPEFSDEGDDSEHHDTDSQDEQQVREQSGAERIRRGSLC